MNNIANFNLVNGLGDQLLETIGFYILCKYLNYKPNIKIQYTEDVAWGNNNNFDISLFNYSNDIIFSNSDLGFYNVYSPYPTASLSPFKLFSYLKKYIPEITFEQINKDFLYYSKEIIKPSDIILSKIPSGLENVYGVHLRKTDKIRETQYPDRLQNTINEFIIIANKLLEDIINIINTEEEPSFLFVSEDNEWKNEFIKNILDICNLNNKKIKIIELDYTNENKYSNYNSILDMFCLSRCKEILQGVKHSGFSIIASLLGNCKIRNYSNYIDGYDICAIHLWSSLIEINNKKNIDIEYHEEYTKYVPDINTNIDKIFVYE
jgi:hypothetical protein